MAALKRSRYDEEGRCRRDVRPRSFHSSLSEILLPRKGLDIHCSNRWPPASRSGEDDEIGTLRQQKGLSRNYFQSRDLLLRPRLGIKIDRNGGRHPDVNEGRHFDRNCNRSTDRDSDRNLDRIGDRRFERGGRRSMDRDCDRSGDRNIDENFDRNCIRNLERNNVRNFDRHTDRNFDRHIGRNFDRNLGRDAHRDIDRNIDRNFDRDGGRSIDRKSNRDCNRNIGINIDGNCSRDGGRNIDGNFDRDGDRSFDGNIGRYTEARVRFRQQWQRDGGPWRYQQKWPWNPSMERSRPRVSRQGADCLYDNCGDSSRFPPVDTILTGGGSGSKGEEEDVILRDTKVMQASHSYAVKFANGKLLPSACLVMTEMSPRVSDGNPSKDNGENDNREEEEDDDDENNEDEDYDDNDDDDDLCDYSEVEDVIEERARIWSSLTHTIRTSSSSSSISNGSNDGGVSSVLTTELEGGSEWQAFLRAIDDRHCVAPQASEPSDSIHKMSVVLRDRVGEEPAVGTGGFELGKVVLQGDEQKALPLSIDRGSSVLQDCGPWELLGGIGKIEAVLQEGELRVPPCHDGGGSAVASLLDGGGGVIVQDKATLRNGAVHGMEPPSCIEGAGVNGNSGLQVGAFAQPKGDLVVVGCEEHSVIEQCGGGVGVTLNCGVHRSWPSLGLAEIEPEGDKYGERENIFMGGWADIEPEGDQYGTRETVFMGGWEVPQQDTADIDHQSNDNTYIGSNENYIGPIDDGRGFPSGGCDGPPLEGFNNIGPSDNKRVLPLGSQVHPLEDDDINIDRIGSTDDYIVISDDCSRVPPRQVQGLVPSASPPLEGNVNNTTTTTMFPNGSKVGQEGSQEDNWHNNNNQPKHVVWSKACALAWLFLNPP